MKKTGLLLLLLATVTLAAAQPSVDDHGGDAGCIRHHHHGGQRAIRALPDADRGGHLLCRVSLPRTAFPTPTTSTAACRHPTSTKFEIGELVYLAGSGYQAGQLYSIVREMRDVNEYEIYPGQTKIAGRRGTPLRRNWPRAGRRYAQSQRHRPGGIQLRSHQPGRCRRAVRGKAAGCVPRARAFRPFRAAEWKAERTDRARQGLRRRRSARA